VGRSAERVGNAVTVSMGAKRCQGPSFIWLLG